MHQEVATFGGTDQATLRRVPGRFQNRITGVVCRSSGECRFESDLVFRPWNQA